MFVPLICATVSSQPKRPHQSSAIHSRLKQGKAFQIPDCTSNTWWLYLLSGTTRWTPYSVTQHSTTSQEEVAKSRGCSPFSLKATGFQSSVWKYKHQISFSVPSKTVLYKISKGTCHAIANPLIAVSTATLYWERFLKTKKGGDVRVWVKCYYWVVWISFV